jgi:hypothetical protein
LVVFLEAGLTRECGTKAAGSSLVETVTVSDCGRFAATGNS